MKAPDPKICIRLLRQTSTPVHIMRHCVKVAAVSTWLGKRLLERGSDLNMDILVAGGLLHDVSKYQSIVSGGDHALMGARFVEGLGYPEIAKIIKHHVYLDKDTLRDGNINEEMVVNYADKRVKHVHVVSLEDRFKDLQARYGTSKERRERINGLFIQSKEMERLIFSKIGMHPEELNKIFRRKSHGK